MEHEKQSVMVRLWRKDIWVFALMVLAGIGLGAIKLSNSQTAAAFSESGIQVMGQITNKSDYTSSKRKTFRISYTFATTADPYTNGEQLVSQAFYEAQTDEGPIAIWYLPTDPTQNAVDLGKLSQGLWLTLMIALGLILTGIVGGGIIVSRTFAAARQEGH